MKIDRRGQEFASFTVAGVPADANALEVSFDNGATWTVMDWNADETAVQVLVAGPDMPNPGGVTLTLGRNVPLIRLVDNPETVIRQTGGSIDVA